MKRFHVVQDSKGESPHARDTHIGINGPRSSFMCPYTEKFGAGKQTTTFKWTWRLTPRSFGLRANAVACVASYRYCFIRRSRGCLQWELWARSLEYYKLARLFSMIVDVSRQHDLRTENRFLRSHACTVPKVCFPEKAKRACLQGCGSQTVHTQTRAFSCYKLFGSVRVICMVLERIPLNGRFLVKPATYEIQYSSCVLNVENWSLDHTPWIYPFLSPAQENFHQTFSVNVLQYKRYILAHVRRIIL